MKAVKPKNDLELSNDLYVAKDRIKRGEDYLSLHDFENMDMDAFNKLIAKYDIRPVKKSSNPIDRLVKYSILLSRKYDYFIPSNEEYVNMVIDAAIAKTKGQEPLASFYETMFLGRYLDVTRDILKFVEKTQKGYKAELRRFNKDGELKSMPVIDLPKEGWMKTLNIYGLAIETNKEDDPVELGIPALSHVKGLWYIEEEPELGEERLVCHCPNWGAEKLLDISVKEKRSYSGKNTAILLMRRADNRLNLF
jgi:hypothetical protein